MNKCQLHIAETVDLAFLRFITEILEYNINFVWLNYFSLKWAHVIAAIFYHLSNNSRFDEYDHIILLNGVQHKTMTCHFSHCDTIFEMILFYYRTWRENIMKNCFRCKFIHYFRGHLCHSVAKRRKTKTFVILTMTDKILNFK